MYTSQRQPPEGDRTSIESKVPQKEDQAPWRVSRTPLKGSNSQQHKASFQYGSMRRGSMVGCRCRRASRHTCTFATPRAACCPAGWSVHTQRASQRVR
eukprot:729386-Pelagomonas_calceolata.AAC.2